MALNEAFRLTPKDATRSWVSWEAPAADCVSWVFVNGVRVVGPLYAGEIARSVRIPHPTNGTVAVEIHDVASEAEPVDPVAVRPNTQPELSWNPVTEAVRYRVYHRVKGGLEARIYDQPAAEGTEHYRITCPVLLEGKGGVWHFFRVEAVDRYGNESTREVWTYFVWDLPAAPGGLLVTDGSAPGVFDFEIT